MTDLTNKLNVCWLERDECYGKREEGGSFGRAKVSTI